MLQSSDVEYFCFKHNEHDYTEGAYERVQEVLDQTDLFVAHNAKYDLEWLEACGFKYSGDVWCTQIAEYVLLRGRKSPLKLSALTEKHELTRKKSDLTAEYLADGVGFEAIPWDVVDEYGRGDIVSTYELFLHQLKRYSHTDNKGLLPTVHMMCTFTYTLMEMEKNGLPVDFDELSLIKTRYIKEHNALRLRLTEMAQDAVGDTPISLTSNDFMSCLLYSRSINDKEEWKKVFNIGTDKRKRPLPRTRMTRSLFNKHVRKMTSIFYKTVATHCKTCDGKGWIYTLTKAGVPYKNMPRCRHCHNGVIYTPTNKVAGFKLTPRSTADLSTNGFSTNADIVASSIGRSAGITQEFMKNYARYNAISTYLSTFVEGIERYTGEDGILRTNLNQTIAATGRLSSSGPNLHNMPRANTFPVRRAFVSRFEGGSILKADYGQLEFRVAGFLSKCPVVLQEILDGVDAHAYTASIIFGKTKEDADFKEYRQQAKAHTFKPLYGGMSGSEDEVTYYKAFLKKFTGVKQWHEELKSEALTTHRVRILSGREYSFPGARRLPGGYVKYTTQIVNYPVQGFATGDLVPLGCIATHRILRKHPELKSLLILTVHDDLEADVYPGEEEIMADIFEEGLLSLPEMCEEFYGFTLDYPLEIELSIGPNLLEQTEIRTITR